MWCTSPSPSDSVGVAALEDARHTIYEDEREVIATMLVHAVCKDNQILAKQVHMKYPHRLDFKLNTRIHMMKQY